LPRRGEEKRFDENPESECRQQPISKGLISYGR